MSPRQANSPFEGLRIYLPNIYVFSNSLWGHGGSFVYNQQKHFNEKNIFTEFCSILTEIDTEIWQKFTEICSTENISTESFRTEIFYTQCIL